MSGCRRERKAVVERPRGRSDRSGLPYVRDGPRNPPREDRERPRGTESGETGTARRGTDGNLSISSALSALECGS